MNPDTGQAITTLSIGDHVDATAFDPDARLIFNSNGEGSITVICQDSPDKHSVAENVKTLPKAKTIGARSQNASAFSVRSGSGTV